MGGLNQGSDLRESNFRRALLAAAGGAVLMAAGLLMLPDGDALSLVVAGAGAVCFIAGLAGIYTFRRREAARQDPAAGSYRDRVQRERTSSIMVLPISTLLLTVIGMRQAAEWLEGDRDLSSLFLAVAVLANVVLIPIMVMGWDVTARTQKKLLDDELTRAYRAQAMIAAFWVLLIGTTVVWMVGLWKPNVAVIVLPSVLWLTAATAGLRYALLHRAADRDE